MESFISTANCVWNNGPVIAQKIPLPLGDIDNFVFSHNQTDVFAGKTNFDAATSKRNDLREKDSCKSSLVNISKWNAVNDTGREIRQNESRRNNSYKTALCQAYKETGTCASGDLCRFAHGGKELRLPPQAHPKYKTQLCNKFALYGRCPFGPKCQFIHHRPSSLTFRRPVMVSESDNGGSSVMHVVTDDSVKQPATSIAKENVRCVYPAHQDLPMSCFISSSGGIEFQSSFPGANLNSVFSFKRDSKSVNKTEYMKKKSQYTSQLPDKSKDDSFRENASILVKDWQSSAFDCWSFETESVLSKACFPHFGNSSLWTSDA